MEAGGKGAGRQVGVVRHGGRPHGDARPCGEGTRAGPGAESEVGGMGEAGPCTAVDLDACVWREGIAADVSGAAGALSCFTSVRGRDEGTSRSSGTAFSHAEHLS